MKKSKNKEISTNQKEENVVPQQQQQQQQQLEHTEDDIEWYRKEIGEEPTPGLFFSLFKAKQCMAPFSLFYFFRIIN
jgi:hypothetical protein